MSRQKPKVLGCGSAWIAFEQHNRLARQGWKVSVLNRAGKPVTIGQLEAAAQTESGTVVIGIAEEAGGPPISARNLLMGS